MSNEASDAAEYASREAESLKRPGVKVWRLGKAERGRLRAAAGDELSSENVKLRNRNAKAKKKEDTNRLRVIVAKAAIAFVGFQLVASGVFFGFYLWHNRDNVQSEIMIAWLSSTVVEIVGILGIVAVSLFPNRNGRGSKKSKD